ncbi:hypothetical protein WMY93_008204 [Mugilogobius chulae]|uniref:Uncharacterized protein n=1 Tax=Mugilogobius chulae TaxID=88201 RepID=A0AAW0PF91_9GOBI
MELQVRSVEKQLQRLAQGKLLLLLLLLLLLVLLLLVLLLLDWILGSFYDYAARGHHPDRLHGDVVSQLPLRLIARRFIAVVRRGRENEFVRRLRGVLAAQTGREHRDKFQFPAHGVPLTSSSGCSDQKVQVRMAAVQLSPYVPWFLRLFSYCPCSVSDGKDRATSTRHRHAHTETKREVARVLRRGPANMVLEQSHLRAAQTGAQMTLLCGHTLEDYCPGTSCSASADPPVSISRAM